MLWVYPVLDGLLDRTVKQPSLRQIQRIEKAAAISNIGRAAYRRYTAQHAAAHGTFGQTSLSGDTLGGHESLLSATTLGALQDMRAVDAEVMVYAMIAAAQADGRVDDAERRRIFTHLHTLTASPDERATVQALLEAPLSLEAVLARVTSPDMALEVYTASLLVIDHPSPVERAYLATLAQRLRLDPAVVARLHHQFGEDM